MDNGQVTMENLNEAKSPQLNNLPELRFPGFDDSWFFGKLGELINTLDAGVSVNSEDKHANIDEKGILKTSCVTNGYFDPNENKLVNQENEINRLKEPVQCETIIISRMNTPALVGANSYVDKSYPNLFLPDRLWAAKVNNNHFPKWVGYLVSHFKTRSIFSARGTGTSGSMKNITKSDVLTAPTFYPSYKEQQKIANFLTAVDQRIGLLKQKKAALETYKKGLMQKIFSQEIRFKPDSNSPLSRGDSGVCSTQNSNNNPDWEEKTLGGVTKITMGTSPKSSAYNNVKNGLPLIQGNADISKRVSCPRVYTSEITKECFPNDLLLSVRAPVGEISKSNHHACIGRGMATISAKNDIVIEFIYQYLLWFEPRWRSISQGSTFESVNSKDISSLKLLLPSKTEQQKIADCLSAVDQSINQLTKQINQTTQFKKGLLQRMFV